MMTKIRTSMLTAACLLACLVGATTAGAQEPATTTTQDDPTVRPAVSSASGDTGLWFVPTADMLDRHAWSVSAYHTGFTPLQGFTNVENFSGTFGYGLVRG